MTHEHALKSLHNKITGKQWKRIGTVKRAGILTPLSALRSSSSLGIGEIMDLKPLIDWCRVTGNSIIQLLPLNEMNHLDKSPYSALSVFAIDPLYVSLHGLDRFHLLPEISDYITRNAREIENLRNQERVNFNEVRRTKMELLRILFRDGYDKEAFSSYIEANQYWIDDYALFMVLKEKHELKQWLQWQEPYKNRDTKALQEFSETFKEELLFYKFVQWILFSQLQSVKLYGECHGIFLMGDLPILVSRDSADVWAHQDYFDLKDTVGAPPDMYSTMGQKWGLPPYEWDNMKANGYDWWIARLKYAEHFYHMFRLDHVIGFFRFYIVPEEASDAVDGHYEPVDDTKWKEHGAELLKMIIENTDMLVLGEDLGAVPPCTREIMEEFGIPGFKVERWERRYDKDSSYINPADFYPVSLSTLSTHDSETVRGWWQNYPDERQVYYKTLGFDGTPPDTLEGLLEETILKRIYSSASVFTILGMWDILGLNHGTLHDDPAQNRVNVPATVTPNNWTLRYRFDVQDMLGKNFVGFNDKISNLIEESGRKVLN
ncbi:MAG TPA: 4-alpha-glucanotransferase, partial [Thermodesulfovibrionia bacterium]|nr:4-alpha-glucanotransferase [Thermodesulfovibrionia bacterium]